MWQVEPEWGDVWIEGTEMLGNHHFTLNADEADRLGEILKAAPVQLREIQEPRQ